MRQVLDEEEESTRPGWVQRAVFKITAFGPERDGRVVAAGALVAYLMVVAIPRLFWGINLWPRLSGVPAAPTLFFDTRVITSGLDCSRMGFDPLTYNPCDMSGRPMNYPRVWLLLKSLGVGQSQTDVLGVIFIGVFFASFFLLMGRLTMGEGAIVALAVCSPSVMFGVERANSDIVVFALVAAAVVAWRADRSRREVAGPLLVLVAAFLKLYPVFALPSYLMTRRRNATMTAAICIAVFAAYVVVYRGDIEAIVRATPHGQYNSYGARILPAAIYHRVVPQAWGAGFMVKLALAIVPLLIGAMAWVIGRRRLPRSDAGEGDWSRLAFTMGSLLFLGTFALSINFGYRLVLLLLTLPQLFRWIGDPSHD
ncbi:MAG TPA: glycosyltransferase 87 family protein, partial [Candidatus Limnocylindrales bacterium]